MSKNNFLGWEKPGKAFVTGASSGMGEEYARQLAEYGFHLVLVARRKEKLETLAAELIDSFSIHVEILVADLSKQSENMRVVSYIKNLGDLDCIINAAGYAIWRSFLGIDIDKHLEYINVNFTGPIMFCHAGIPNMIKRKRGIIVNVSSSGVIDRTPGVIYYTTKSGLVSFSEKLHEKMEKKGILVQSLCPGLVYTEFHDEAISTGKFKRNWFPKEAWSTPTQVVSSSIEAFSNDPYYPFVITGEFDLKKMKEIRKKTVDDLLDLRRFS